MNSAKNHKKLYKKEIKKLRKRHNLYAQELEKLLNYHQNPNTSDDLIYITDPDEMVLVCELLDIGYLDLNVITVHKENDAIYRVLYNKGYPLTTSGEAQLQKVLSSHPDLPTLSGRMRIIIVIISMAVIITLLFYFLF